MKKKNKSLNTALNLLLFSQTTYVSDKLNLTTHYAHVPFTPFTFACRRSTDTKTRYSFATNNVSLTFLVDIYMMEYLLIF